MTNFLVQFPKTKHSKRVMFGMANVALEEGWRLAWQSKPDKAATYLDMARGLFSGVAVDKEADMTDLEVIESRIGTVRAFYAKQDYAGLTNWVTQIVANLPAGEKYWLVFKLYDAPRSPVSQIRRQRLVNWMSCWPPGSKAIPAMMACWFRRPSGASALPR